MSKRSSTRFLRAIVVVALGLLATPSAFAAANIVIQNNDAAGVGFNDPTPAAPVGGNSGTTVGQQRLIAFQFAAGIWGATIDSGPTITIQANWAALPCTATTGTLGSAGTINIFRDFPNAPFPNTWYSAALANKLAGIDQDNTTAEISAQFNFNLGAANCLPTSPWYYGLDNNHGNSTDLVTVLLHEFSHGLGFQTFTSASTGAQNGGFPSIFDRFLMDNSTGKTWVQMTNTERAASAISGNHLVWSGPAVVADAPTVLSGSPTLRINSPPAIAGTKQIGTAEFGPPLSVSGITAAVSGTSPADGCAAISTNLAGKIAFIDRGTCNFTVKVKNAQNVGALGVIIGNVATSVNPDIPPGLGGTDPTITIPSVGIAQTDANAIRGQLVNNINASLFVDNTVLAGADSANRVLMFAPNPIQSGSSVSHYDTTAFPNLLMEPNISDDLTHSVTAPQDLTFELLRDIGWTGASSGTTVQFSAANYSVNEAAGNVTITVTRSGDTSGTATVAYSTADADNFTVGCGAITGNAFARCDFATSVDTLTFGPGETSKSFPIPIINDSIAEGPETFQVVLSNATGAALGSPSTATVTIIDDDAVTGPNPIFTTPFFVRQQYLDFLSREPEVGEPWSAILNGCANPFNTDPMSPSAACDRILVSGAFFGSPEFQLKGYFVYRFYKVAFARLPLYTEIVVDMRAVTGQTQADVFAKKGAFTNAFVLRPEFTALGALPIDQYVNTLMGRYNLTQITTPDPANPDGANKVTLTTAQLIASSLTRAQILRAIADSDQVFNAEFNQAFVSMQYFGYLRRNPDTAGFNSWLDFLNTHPGDSRTMVNGFMNSIEYRLRFGPNQ